MWSKNVDTIFVRFVANHAFDRQTDRQADRRTDGQLSCGCVRIQQERCAELATVVSIPSYSVPTVKSAESEFIFLLVR